MTTANDNLEAEPQEIVLDGQGPFQLPLCSDADLALGERLAIVTFTTLAGQRVHVPINYGTLLQLGQVVSQTLIDLAGDET